MFSTKLRESLIVNTIFRNIRLVSNKVKKFGSIEDMPDDNVESKPRVLKEWKKIPRGLNVHDSNTATMDRSFQFFNPEAPQNHTLDLNNFRAWIKRIKVVADKSNQKFDPELYDSVGNELALAQFVMFRGGRVMFHNNTKWYTQSDDLPQRFNPNYILWKVDTNGMSLYNEGIENFRQLSRLKWLSLRGSKIDEWSIDHLTNNVPSLEYLDVSNCPNLPARGLEALYKVRNLRSLIVTSYKLPKVLELTCLMLEECLPNLNCTILEPDQPVPEIIDI